MTNPQVVFESHAHFCKPQYKSLTFDTDSCSANWYALTFDADLN